MQNKTFVVTSDEVATLVLLNIRLLDMLDHNEVDAEILPEVQFLQQKLERLLLDLDVKEKPILHHHSKV